MILETMGSRGVIAARFHVFGIDRVKSEIHLYRQVDVSKWKLENFVCIISTWGRNASGHFKRKLVKSILRIFFR